MNGKGARSKKGEVGPVNSKCSESRKERRSTRGMRSSSPQHRMGFSHALRDAPALRSRSDVRGSSRDPGISSLGGGRGWAWGQRWVVINVAIKLLATLGAALTLDSFVGIT